jgi:leucyl aminopeptidase
MEINISTAEKLAKQESFALLADGHKMLSTPLLTAKETSYINDLKRSDPERGFVMVPRLGQQVFVVWIKEEEPEHLQWESCRRAGSKLADLMAEEKTERVFLTTDMPDYALLIAFAEGFVLSAYRYTKHFSEAKALKQSHPVTNAVLVHPNPDPALLNQLRITMRYTCFVRDLVNEPPAHLNAKGLATTIAHLAEQLPIKAEIFSKSRIEALKMGGLLAVNRGSTDEPSFTVLEYHPQDAINERPVVLIGKGVIFDTGGMNLKTGNFMDGMKSDMAGAATMAGTLMAVAALKLPVYVVALIPATDNRVDGNAMVPGDVITMHDGTTVEIKNTDAEGRLILADAISYANRFQPLLVIDAATLTGAAMRAIGHYGIVAMERGAPSEMNLLRQAGEAVYERIAEFPMWREYEEQLKSDIADLANIGSGNGGAITAAKFLAHFTTAPFIHLDIAGPAFIDKKEHYQPKGGTGIGVRLLTSFIASLGNIIHP